MVVFFSCVSVTVVFSVGVSVVVLVVVLVRPTGSLAQPVNPADMQAANTIMATVVGLWAHVRHDDDIGTSVGCVCLSCKSHSINASTQHTSRAFPSR